MDFKILHLNCYSYSKQVDDTSILKGLSNCRPPSHTTDRHLFWEDESDLAIKLQIAKLYTKKMVVHLLQVSTFFSVLTIPSVKVTIETGNHVEIKN